MTNSHSSYPKAKCIGGTNFTFTLFEDGSASFQKAIRPKETVHLNHLQVLDMYDVLTEFLQSSPTTAREET